MRLDGVRHRLAPEPNDNLWLIMPQRGWPMPPWMELLLNVIGYAGFIGVAMYHKRPNENLPD
jgi:hypothetical protein